MTQTELPVDERQKCVKVTNSGSRCTRWARSGEDLCGQHAGLTKARTPTGLTAIVQDEIFENLKAGLTLEQACDLAGAARSTVYDWLARAKETGSADEYRAFASGVELARIHLEKTTLEHLTTAAKDGNVRAQIFLLERLNPERFRAGQIRLPVEPSKRAAEQDEPRADSNVVPLRPAGDGNCDW